MTARQIVYTIYLGADRVNPAKDAINLAKHGLSLALAKQFDWLTGRVHSARTVGGEQRWKLIVLFEGVVYAVIFTD